MGILSKFFVLSLVLITAACTQKQSTTEFLGGEEPGIFSNRPQSRTHFIAIVKLKSPGLLASAEQKDGQTVVNQDALANIKIEQEQALKELKDISSEIRVIYSYQYVLNGFAVVAPNAVKDRLRAAMNVGYVESEGSFSRPVTLQDRNVSALASILDKNSVDFIGADKLQAEGIKGQGITVGVIDTGIDYTHSMLGGPGTIEAFKGVNPDSATPLYPNDKVVGGIDLVGTVYNSGAGEFSKHIPLPDNNPIDEAGHGTHVAGTIAGIGDGVESYSGVAPEAKLHSLKVFGADGSTGDSVVIAALEYAADPNKDGNLSDQLDVVNLSLGSSFGSPHVLYGEAIRNLSGGGTIVVASAGNSGDVDNIVGAPSVIDEAISVAASIDHTDHNWKFRAVQFNLPSLGEKAVEAIEGSISKPIAEAGPVQGKLVFAGIADTDFTAELASQIQGNVAFIDRGKVAFADKVKRAFEAGAIGVVIGNNQPSAPIPMGGEGKWDIPAIMITQALGTAIKEELKKGDVVIQFQTDTKIEKPELIDTITGFSSRGPRSIDALIKPEISAPGSSIISAAIGGGNKTVKLSGTSMSAPHISGVVALLVQAHKDFNSQEIKSILMGRSKTIVDAEKKIYPIARQGAGRVDTYEAAKSLLVSDTASLSLGVQNLVEKKTVKKELSVRSLTDKDLALTFEFVGSKGVTLLGSPSLNLKAKESKGLAVKFQLQFAENGEAVQELDGWLLAKSEGKEVFRWPLLAVARKMSVIGAEDLIIHSSRGDSSGALAELTLRNDSQNEGQALIFNLLAQDARKQDLRNDPFLSRACDLQAAGYRIVEKDIAGVKKQILQVAGKLYEPTSSWSLCELSVLIDSNGDEVAEQELAAIEIGNLPGLSNGANDRDFVSVLLDAAKTRELRAQYELAAKTDDKVTEDYSSAVVDAFPLKPITYSTILIVEADVTALVKRGSGEFAIKVATIHNEASSVEGDDFLAESAQKWVQVSSQKESQSFLDIPETVTLKGGETQTIDLTKGEGNSSLMVLLPQNRTVFSDVVNDSQILVLDPKFK